MSMSAQDLRLLQMRRDRILNKMQVLSDAPMPGPAHERPVAKTRPPRPLGLRVSDAENPREHGYISRHSHHDSAPPQGVEFGECAGNSHAPSKRLSLFAHYKWRFQHAHDVVTLTNLCAMAERDYLEYTGVFHRPHDESHSASVHRLLTDWRGCEDIEVAHWECCPVRWVRRHRALNGWEPTFGDERLRVDARTARILELAGEGKSVRAIATALDVTPRIVQVALENV